MRIGRLPHPHPGRPWLLWGTLALAATLCGAMFVGMHTTSPFARCIRLREQALVRSTYAAVPERATHAAWTQCRQKLRRQQSF